METQRGTAGTVIEVSRDSAQVTEAVPAIAPYVAALVVPPITAPIRRPTPEMLRNAVATPVRVDAPFADERVPSASAPAPAPELRRDRARHRSVRTASFPEPPTRCSLVLSDLRAAVSRTSGLPTIERLDLFAAELTLRDLDRARLAAWEARVHPIDDPELDAARAWVRALFADLGPTPVRSVQPHRIVGSASVAPPTGAEIRREHAPIVRGVTGAAPALLSVPPIPDLDRNAIEITKPIPRLVPTPIARAVPPMPEGVAEPAIPDLVQPARPVSPPVASVLAAPMPTLVPEPAQAPPTTAEATFAAAIRAHEHHTGEIALTFPLTPVASGPADAVDVRSGSAEGRPSWWRRIVDRLLAPFRRR